MQKRIPIKNHHQEVQLVAHRTMLALVILVVAVLFLIARLAYLQIYKNDVYSTLSTQNWLDLVPIEPTRGLIYDRNGIMLAENIPVFSLDLIPFQVNDLNKTINALGKIVELDESDLAQFKKQLKQHRRFDEIPLKLRLSEEEVARFTENQHQFPGVLIKARLMRNYPHGTTFSHVLGYVGRINAQELNEIDQTNYSASHYIGKLGIEKYYEDELHGKVGYEEVENDASGKSVRVLKEIKGTSGHNLYLTIDSGLQYVAEKALHGSRGAVVAIQPATGQVLSMVSEPSYDPNPFVTGISQKDYRALQTSENRPLFNRALRGQYPLASTIKPFFALEGLNSGAITPDTRIFDPGWFELSNSTHRFHDWWHPGHGMVDVSKAIIASCDTFFYTLATRMGIRRMDHILTEFGFGAVSGIDLEDELPGIVASPEWKRQAKGSRWYDGDTVISGIGQGYMQATPLQLAAATATMASRGQRYIPYLLMGEELPNSPFVEQKPTHIDPIKLEDKRHWDIVIKAMQDVVATPQGTAYRYGRNRGYTVAAKTGTAQVAAKRGNPEERDNEANIPERLRDHHLFIAFAPVENPKIALAIITENSNSAVETARTIFDYYLTCPRDKRKITAMLTANANDPNNCYAPIPSPEGMKTNVVRQSQIQTKKTPA